MNGLTKIEELEHLVSNLRRDLVLAHHQSHELLAEVFALKALLRRAHPNMHTDEMGQWFTDRDEILSASVGPVREVGRPSPDGFLSTGATYLPDPRDKRIEELVKVLEHALFYGVDAAWTERAWEVVSAKKSTKAKQ